MIEAIVRMTWPDVGPVMDADHQEALLRIADPSRAWLRDICKIVESGDELSASEIAENCSLNGILIPGCREDADERGRARAVGMAVAPLFKKEDTLFFDDVKIERKERRVKRDDGEGYTDLKIYRFLKG